MRDVGAVADADAVGRDDVRLLGLEDVTAGEAVDAGPHRRDGGVPVHDRLAGGLSHLRLGLDRDPLTHGPDDHVAQLSGMV